MLVDGKAIAADIYREIKNELSHLKATRHLTIFTCDPNFATKKYLELKCKKAAEVGIDTNVIEIPSDCTTEDFIQSLKPSFIQTDGIIVQLPLPGHFDTEAILSAIPKELDVDGFHYDGSDHFVLPPVVAAIDEIARRNNVMFAGSNIVIVGEGKLVGAPARAWVEGHGWQAHVVTEITPHPEKFFAGADILILGTGQPGLIQPDVIKDGVVIFDAATSEQDGKLVGDAATQCVEKARLMTPVPGGIGPMTIAILLRNLIRLSKR